MSDELSAGFLKKSEKVAIISAKKAGKIVMKHFGNQHDFFAKDGVDFATEADLASEKFILNQIRKFFPEHAILAEESGKHSKKSDFLWCIDPVDGTHNFARGLSLFGVSIGLAYKGFPVLGVIYFPIQKELYSAVQGKGAFLNGKRIRVSKNKDIKRAYFTLDWFPSSFWISSTFKKVIGLNADSCLSLRSSVHETMVVASGKADFCIQKKTTAWDCCASTVIIQEAGGKVTNFKGKKWSIFDEKFLASNDFFHSKVLKVLK